MHTCRTRFKKDIVTEFVPAADQASQKVMIFLSGIPSVPCKDDVLWFWANEGYWTFFPRYRGSWESTGSFLARSPERDVIDVIDSLPNTFKDFWNGKKYRIKPKSITLVGSSFGGPAAILASRDPRVNKSICISPVVDWQAEDKSDPLIELYRLLRSAYGPVYRVKKSNWNKLSNGKFYNPAYASKQIDGRKILIFHAKNDNIVKFKPVARFAEEIKANIITLKKGGHLSSTLLSDKKYFTTVKKFLSSELF